MTWSVVAAVARQLTVPAAMAPVEIKLVFWNRPGVYVAVADEVVEVAVADEVEEAAVVALLEETEVTLVVEVKPRRFAFTQETGWQISAASTAQPESSRRRMREDSIAKQGSRREKDIIAVAEQAMD